jgi:Recombinase zinc beta ribbon domain
MLQGVLQCASCGYSCYGMYRTSKRGKTIYRYYRCVGNEPYRFDGQRMCDNKGIRTDVLEDAVWEDVCALLRDPDRVRQEYERRLEGERDTTTCKQLDALIHEASRAIARLIDAYKDDLLSKDEFEPRIRADKLRLAKLQEERKTVATRDAEYRQLRLVITHLEDFYQRVSEGLQTINWQTKREIIRALVQRVELDNTNVRVVYKISTPSFVASRSQNAILQDRSPRVGRVFCPYGQFIGKSQHGPPPADPRQARQASHDDADGQRGGPDPQEAQAEPVEVSNSHSDRDTGHGAGPSAKRGRPGDEHGQEEQHEQWRR